MVLKFSSDPHLGHFFISEWRGFSSVKQMDECIMDNYADNLTYKDGLVLVGDIAFGDKENAYKLLKKLPCRKILVSGNHDNEKIKSWDLWESVFPYYSFRENKKHLVLFHYPIEDWDRKHYGSIHLHGHEHGALSDFKNRIDVGVDNPKWRFKPVSLDEIVEKVKDLPLHGDVGHHKYRESQ